MLNLQIIYLFVFCLSLPCLACPPLDVLRFINHVKYFDALPDLVEFPYTDDPMCPAAKIKNVLLNSVGVWYNVTWSQPPTNASKRPRRKCNDAQRLIFRCADAQEEASMAITLLRKQ